MAYVTTYKFKNDKTECSIRVNVGTNSGEFSCKLPEFAKPYISVENKTELGRKHLDVRRGDWHVVANTLNELRLYLDHLWTYQAPKERSYPVKTFSSNQDSKFGYCQDNFFKSVKTSLTKGKAISSCSKINLESINDISFESVLWILSTT